MADPQAALREWIVEGLKSKGHGSGRELASRLGVEPEILSRMKNTDGLKETRRIEAHMIPAIAEYFGTIPPGFDGVTELRCATCAIPATHREVKLRRGEAVMPEKSKAGITINIETPQQGTLVVGDNNIVTTHNDQNSASGAALAAEQAMALDTDVKEVATAKGVEPEEVWAELCTALDIADSALITRETFPTAEKILARWKGKAVQDAVNQGG